MPYTASQFNNQDLYKIYDAIVNGGGGVAGSGTLNYLPKFTPDGTTIGDSRFFDNGTRIGINKFSSFSNFSFITIKDPGVLFEDSVLEIEDFSGNLMYSFNNSGKFGIGAGRVPSHYLTVIGTSNQIKSGYDNTTNYFTITTNSAGLTQFDSNTTQGFQFLDQVYNLGKNGIAGNTAFGLDALIGNNSSTGANTAIGNSALKANTSGVNNTAVGLNSMLVNTTGSYNVAVGVTALLGLINGQENTAVGESAGRALISGINSTFVGRTAGYNTTGSYSTCVGHAALYSNTTGVENVAIGRTALYTTTGDNNTAVGSSALYYNTGSGSVALGFRAGFYETGSNKLFIDNAMRSSEADGRLKALIYGVFDADPANQDIYLNAKDIFFKYIPTASAGLATGQIWSNAGVLTIV